MRYHLIYPAITAASITIASKRGGYTGLSWLDAWLARRHGLKTLLVEGFLASLTNYELMVICDHDEDREERVREIFARVPEEIHRETNILLDEIWKGVDTR